MVKISKVFEQKTNEEYRVTPHKAFIRVGFEAIALTDLLSRDNICTI